jgi:hypothetical protein
VRCVGVPGIAMKDLSCFVWPGVLQSLRCSDSDACLGITKLLRISLLSGSLVVMLDGVMWVVVFFSHLSFQADPIRSQPDHACCRSCNTTTARSGCAIRSCFAACKCTD